MCYLQRKSVFVRPLPNADFLSSDWFIKLRKVSLSASKIFFSNVVTTSHSSCVFLYLFSRAYMQTYFSLQLLTLHVPLQIGKVALRVDASQFGNPLFIRG